MGTEFEIEGWRFGGCREAVAFAPNPGPSRVEDIEIAYDDHAIEVSIVDYDRGTVRGTIPMAVMIEVMRRAGFRVENVHAVEIAQPAVAS